MLIARYEGIHVNSWTWGNSHKDFNESDKEHFFFLVSFDLHLLYAELMIQLLKWNMKQMLNMKYLNIKQVVKSLQNITYCIIFEFLLWRFWLLSGGRNSKYFFLTIGWVLFHVLIHRRESKNINFFPATLFVS